MKKISIYVAGAFAILTGALIDYGWRNVYVTASAFVCVMWTIYFIMDLLHDVLKIHRLAQRPDHATTRIAIEDAVAGMEELARAAIPADVTSANVANGLTQGEIDGQGGFASMSDGIRDTVNRVYGPDLTKHVEDGIVIGHDYVVARWSRSDIEKGSAGAPASYALSYETQAQVDEIMTDLCEILGKGPDAIDMVISYQLQDGKFVRTKALWSKHYLDTVDRALGLKK
jgi:hypothetical protein